MSMNYVVDTIIIISDCYWNGLSASVSSDFMALYKCCYYYYYYLCTLEDHAITKHDRCAYTL